MTTVKYRANNEIRDLADEAARALVDAGICDLVEPAPPTKGRKPR